MLSIDICFLSFFFVFAHLSESRLVVLRNDEDLPSFIRHAGSKSSPDYTDHDKRPSGLSANMKQKRNKHSKTVMHYGRHIYHLDNFRDKSSSQFKPEAVTFNYVDLYHLIQPSILKSGATDYLRDLVIFSESPLHICDGVKCDEDLRKFSKTDKNDRSPYNKNGRLKRFQIVNNRKKPKQPKYKSSEEDYKKVKQKKKRFKKKKIYSSESTETKESSSEEHKSHKKIKKQRYITSRSSEETKEDKRYDDSNSASSSHEKWKNDDEEDSRSEEDFHRPKKKRNNKKPKVKNKRKTFNSHEQFYVQGSKIYFLRDGASKIKLNPRIKRRRLEPFLPKRYHWDPDEIHELGYYWFNGPKGIYPAPQLLPTINRS